MDYGMVLENCEGKGGSYKSKRKMIFSLSEEFYHIQNNFGKRKGIIGISLKKLDK
jgi:hypothetical protein